MKTTSNDKTQRQSKQAIKLAVRHYLAEAWRAKVTALPLLILPGLGNILVFYAPPLVIASLVKKVSGAGVFHLRDALPSLLVLCGLWLLGELMWRISFFCLAATEAKGIRHSYIYALDQLFRKDLAFFHNNFSGSLTKRVVGFSKNFEGFLDTLALNVFAEIIPLVFVGVVLWRISPWLVLALMGLLLLVLAIVIPLIRRRQKLVALREAAANKTAGYVADIIGNIDAVQAFAHEDYESRRHSEHVHSFVAATARSWRYSNVQIDSFISPIYVFINIVGLTLAVWLGQDAKSTSAILITFNYYAYATRVMWNFNRIYRNLESALTEAAQFTELLLDEPAIHEQASPIKLVMDKGDIQFNSVHFGYAGKHRGTLFDDLNLHIHSGEKIALVGPSGGGKTTITKMLLRFVDVSSGELLIDGQNVAEGRLKDLRSGISYVPQEPLMFHRSIRENIRYGNLAADDDAVVKAAINANAHDFISELPDGYDTMVGERGVKLSGGQRQRIAIARAMIKDAPILVLDEATSALDSDSERLIQDALWKLMAGRTAIVIAHRLSTIQKMDRILVLDHGSIAEQGSHRELLAASGIYAKLWAHQSGGFIDD